LIEAAAIDGKADVDGGETLAVLFRVAGVKQDADTMFHFPLFCVNDLVCIRHQNR
jgi:hypothetical protein